MEEAEAGVTTQAAASVRSAAEEVEAEAGKSARESEPESESRRLLLERTPLPRSRNSRSERRHPGSSACWRGRARGKWSREEEGTTTTTTTTATTTLRSTFGTRMQPVFFVFFRLESVRIRWDRHENCHLFETVQKLSAEKSPKARAARRTSADSRCVAFGNPPPRKKTQQQKRTLATVASTRHSPVAATRARRRSIPPNSKGDRERKRAELKARRGCDASLSVTEEEE